MSLLSFFIIIYFYNYNFHEWIVPWQDGMKQIFEVLAFLPDIHGKEGSKP